MHASISGQWCHAAAFSAAVALVRGFDLSEQEALPSRWNDACRPPWQEADLWHKLRRAAACTSRPAGYLLEHPCVGGRASTPQSPPAPPPSASRNRESCERLPGYTNGEESLLSSLNESPARCLKLAIIFQACRWARGSIADPYTLTEDVLALAEQHQNACLDSLVELEATGRRTEAEDTAEWLLAQISGDHPCQKSADYTRRELTRRFAANPGRQGSLTVSPLYGEILARLMKKGHCSIRSKVGKRITYTFTWD